MVSPGQLRTTTGEYQPPGADLPPSGDRGIAQEALSFLHQPVYAEVGVHLRMDLCALSQDAAGIGHCILLHVGDDGLDPGDLVSEHGDEVVGRHCRSLGLWSYGLSALLVSGYGKRLALVGFLNGASVSAKVVLRNIDDFAVHQLCNRDLAVIGDGVLEVLSRAPTLR